jgi:hypothetical protein
MDHCWHKRTSSAPKNWCASKRWLVSNRSFRVNGTFPNAFFLHTQENTMDKDRIGGAAEQAEGKVKEVAGKFIGGIKDTLRGK